LTVIVEPPGGSGDYLPPGKFEKEGVNRPVTIVFGFVGQARKQPSSREGEE
jgi:hypothetical protein